MAHAPFTAGPAGTTPDAPAPVVIKKYANRRLYNTETSSYITLEHLATMTRDGRDFQVFDAKTGEDITRSVLTQIVMEEEATGQTMLPVPFLRQIIAMYGDSMQSMVPHYLEASMAAFSENQTKFRDAALKPFEQLAKQNLALFQAATEMLTGGKLAPKPAPPAPAADAEVAALKAQLAALQARIDRMAKE
ncbi:polyhydroxyalkanoate synthesis repressor PhaR [Novosphingobium sp. PASSN1]|uniref:polyhydroxyalkanoate synthesis repressor PhaR n=1 Tax=Novosphingobium sp. PASSN1 TaxID=2015561 RepID=UPI000BC4D07B|nr:polyhydroxyalkanoate synthesis repressor PhaR [Novosphingobium sp. PASSN1]OYU34262.1 MAG: polyhydroxyalkanoate synthesis repressor PhaR [Novosphingobium sp. PASSN1]